MNHTEFRDALERLGITQVRFAQLGGWDERTVRRWALDEQPVPRSAEVILLLMLYNPDSAAELLSAQSLLDDEL